MIEVKNVVKQYGNKKVIKNVSVNIAKGKITSFIGPNGAGKSTLLSMISRIIQKDEGEVFIEDVEINDWDKRDSLLLNPDQIKKDISDNLLELEKLGITAQFFLPPYEWYNKQVVSIAEGLGQITVNFSPGTRSNADYTSPEMKNYISSEDILESIFRYEKQTGMNGFHLLIHPGTTELRKDKFYLRIEELISRLEELGYSFQRFK